MSTRDTLPPGSVQPVVLQDLLEVRLSCTACGQKQVWALPADEPLNIWALGLRCYVCRSRSLVYDLSSAPPSG